MPEGEIIAASTTSSQAELDHAVSPSYRNPAALEGPATSLENHEQRAERERKEAAEPGEPEYTRNVKKRIAKEVARRKDLEDRLRKYEPDYKPETKQSNGNGPRPVERTADTRREVEQPAAPDTRREQAPSEHEKRLVEAKHRFTDFDQTMREADAAGVRIDSRLEDEIKALPNSADVVYLLGKNTRIVEELNANPARAAAMVQEISRDLRAHSMPGFQDHVTRCRETFSKEPLTREEIEAGHKIIVPYSVAEAIAEMPNSAELGRHLIRHPEIYQQWKGMREPAILAHVGRISADLDRGGRPKPQTRAPLPIRPIGGGSSSTSSSEAPLEKASYPEYKRRRDMGES